MKFKLNGEYLKDLIENHSKNAYSIFSGFVLGAFEESASGPDGALENIVESVAYTSGYFLVERISEKIFKNPIGKHVHVSGPYFLGGLITGQTLASYVKKQIINS
jgi:hypothetical protein